MPVVVVGVVVAAVNGVEVAAAAVEEVHQLVLDLELVVLVEQEHRAQMHTVRDREFHFF